MPHTTSSLAGESSCDGKVIQKHFIIISNLLKIYLINSCVIIINLNK